MLNTQGRIGPKEIDSIVARTAALELARTCARIAEEKKGKDVSIRDVANLVKITDYFVLISATSRRQAQAIGEAIASETKGRGNEGRLEGQNLGWWVLLDLGEVVVHILQEEARSYYDLDHLWADAREVPLSARPSRRKAKIG